MFLLAVFLLASTKFVFNCADNAKGSDEIHPNSADYDYNPNKLLDELREMTNSLSDAGGKAAEESALAKGCQIIQKLQGNPEYPKVVAEHSELVRLLQSVAKVCNEAKTGNSTSNFELIETFANNGALILAQLKLKEQQLLQESKNAKILQIGGLVAKLCLNVLPEGHHWKSDLKELLGKKVHLLPSDLTEFLINKMNSIAIDEQIEGIKTEAKLTKEQQLGSPKANHRRMLRADQPQTSDRIKCCLVVLAIFACIAAFGFFVGRFVMNFNH